MEGSMVDWPTLLDELKAEVAKRMAQ